MKNLDNDQLIMLEIQAELFELLTKHADSMSQAVAITFKTVVDCYVAQFGRDAGTVDKGWGRRVNRDAGFSRPHGY